MTHKDQTRAILDGSREDMNRAEIKRIQRDMADEWTEVNRRPGGPGAGAIGWLAFGVLVAAYILITGGLLFMWAIQ